MNPIHYMTMLSLNQDDYQRRRVEQQRRQDYEEKMYQRELEYIKKREAYYENLKKKEEL